MEKLEDAEAEAKKLSDVAVDTKLSHGSSSKYPKTKLEDVSIDFCTYDNSKQSYMDSDSVSDGAALSEKEASDMFDSPEVSISMSDSQDNDNDADEEANQAKKELLLKILAFPTSGRPRNVPPASNETFEASQRVSDFEFEPNDGGFKEHSHRAFDILDKSEKPNSRSALSEGVNMEIDRLTDMLKDRRSQFRDLVSETAGCNFYDYGYLRVMISLVLYTLTLQLSYILIVEVSIRFKSID